MICGSMSSIWLRVYKWKKQRNIRRIKYYIIPEQIFYTARIRLREKRRDRCVISLHPRLYRVTYLVILRSTSSAVQVHHIPEREVERWRGEKGWLEGERVRASA